MTNQDSHNSNSCNPFEDTINGLDFVGVDGISCQTIHPIVEDIGHLVADPNADPIGFLSRVQAQVAQCLMSEIMTRVLATGEKGLMDVSITRVHVSDERDEYGDDREMNMITMPEGFLAGMLRHGFATYELSVAAAITRLELDNEDGRIPQGFVEQQGLIGKLFASFESGDAQAADEALTGLVDLARRHIKALEVIGVEIVEIPDDDPGLPDELSSVDPDDDDFDDIGF